MTERTHLHIVKCAHGSYYTGAAHSGLERRIAEHNSGHYDGYTAMRRPVTLVFSQWFDQITDAVAAERQVKGWSRAKKKALIRGDLVRCLRCRSAASDPNPIRGEAGLAAILRDAPCGRSSG